MEAYLITTNKELRTIWQDYEEDVKKIKKGTLKPIESWTCTNTNVQIGDRIFLLCQGKSGNGIIGAGHAVKTSYINEHYEEEKRARYIDVEFDWMLDPKIDKLITKETLEKKIPNQWWRPQSSGIKIKAEEYKKLELLWAKHIGIENDVFNLLQSRDEIEPDKHDGAYELVRETVKSYSRLSDISKVSFADLNLIYLMSIIQKDKSRNKKLIEESNLPDNEKNRLEKILENVWEKSENGKYENVARKPLTIGMFGTGFYTFNKKGADENLPKKIIMALTQIYEQEDSNKIYNFLRTNFNEKIKGIDVASFSVMAHCLKPYVFPIMNRNEGFRSIFELLKISMPKCKTIGDYAECCKIIESYRDKNFRFKNYRVMDIVARMTNEIDFLFTLNYIEKYGGNLYESPSKTGLTQERIDELKEINENKKKAIEQVKKMILVIENNFKLDKNEGAGNWLNTNGTRVRDFLWAQLKYEKFKKTPESISVFFEKSTVFQERGKPRIRFSLEIKNDGASQEAYRIHHRALDLPLDTEHGLCYVIGSTEKHDAVLTNETREQIIEKVKKGIYDKVQISKVIEYNENLTNEECYKEMLEGVEALIPYYEYVNGQQNDEEEATMDTEGVKLGLNTILYGTPGTGKTYNVKKYAVAICDFEGNIAEVNKMPETEIFVRYKELIEEKRIEFTTFHQSYGYEDFIEGIRPKVNEKTGQVEYPVKQGTFKEFCKTAENNGKNCVFIIDEINRGNISKIFGELITLIEPTKRLGEKEEILLKLPYSSEEDTFGVPKNIYILGTMNTADRSIALMDTALRRRFDFIEMMPETNILKEIGADKVVFNGKTLNVVDMLNTINKRIEVLYDREHTIGHAFFAKLKDNPSLHELRSIFENKVMPLLQEYFYDDYEKIQLVLGDNCKTEDKYKFILSEKIEPREVFKGNIDENSIPEKKYKVQKEAFRYIESYIEIC